jgi:hypothetical protein
MAKDTTPKQTVSPAAVPETLAELQKVLKDNAEALRKNAEALRRISDLIDGSGLPKMKLGEGKPKVLFDDGLKYVTGHEKRRVALSQFRKFLGGALEMSEERISEFLVSRIDRWPAIRRSIKTDEQVDSLTRLVAGPTYEDYGGFFFEELESLKAVYQRWRNRQINLKLKENLLSRKKKK